MVRVNLNCAQATALASHLLDALENHKDATEVPPAAYGDEIARIVAKGLGLEPAIVAEGMGVHAQGGQGRGNQSRAVPDARCPANTQQAQGSRPARRPSSPVPVGFKHN
jgi:hypothetical protein